MASRWAQALAAQVRRTMSGLLVGASLCAAVAAAPVLGGDDGDAGAGLPAASPAALPGGMMSSTGQAGQTGPSGRSTAPTGLPETSTGNKNLDLLLELQGRPPETAQRQAAPRSAAAASAAAAALAELRAKAAQRPAPDGAASKPVAQPFEGTATIDADARSGQPLQRREWTGRPGTADGGGSGGGGSGGGGGGGVSYGGGGTGADEPSRSRGGYGDGGLLQRLPREIIEFLRENRYWLLGALAALVAAGAALKAYSRRV